MAGPNTTGKPKTQDYNLGRGIVSVGTLDPTTLKVTKWRDVGNAPDFKVSLTTDKLQHKSSRTGLSVVDKEVVISQSAEISCQLDELNNENLALLFSGSKASHTNVAIAGFTIATLIANVNLSTNTWYDVIKPSTGERAYDIDTAKLALATSAGSPVSLVDGTDYELDSEMGRVFIKDTAKITTAIAGGGTNGNITAVLTADVAASPVSEVQVLTLSSVNVAVKFIASNPADGDRKTEYQFHSVNLTADGDFSLIGQEFTTMSLKGTASANAAIDPQSPTCTIRNVDAKRF